jgi:hypothetical protein
MRRYAIGPKVAGSIPYEVIEYFSIYLILPVALGPLVDSASNRNEYQKQKIFLGSRVRLALKTENLTAICDTIVQTMWDPYYLTTL